MHMPTSQMQWHRTDLMLPLCVSDTSYVPGIAYVCLCLVFFYTLTAYYNVAFSCQLWCSIFLAFVIEAFVLQMELDSFEIEDRLLEKLQLELDKSPLVSNFSLPVHVVLLTCGKGYFQRLQIGSVFLIVRNTPLGNRPIQVFRLTPCSCLAGAWQIRLSASWSRKHGWVVQNSIEETFFLVMQNSTGEMFFFGNAEVYSGAHSLSLSLTRRKIFTQTHYHKK